MASLERGVERREEPHHRYGDCGPGSVCPHEVEDDDCDCVITCPRCRADLGLEPLERREEPQVDLQVEQHGSVVLLRPVSAAGEEWLDENVQSEGWQWFGGALACEPRMVEAVVRGAQGDGLVVG